MPKSKKLLKLSLRPVDDCEIIAVDKNPTAALDNLLEWLSRILTRNLKHKSLLPPADKEAMK